MHTIELSHLRFYAYHGVYEEEKKTGGWFEVNVQVNINSKNFPVQSLDDTIDYTKLYLLVQEIMHTATPLLETVAGGIAKKILDEFSSASGAEVQIKKLNAPIAAFEGEVGVRVYLERH